MNSRKDSVPEQNRKALDEQPELLSTQSRMVLCLDTVGTATTQTRHFEEGAADDKVRAVEFEECLALFDALRNDGQGAGVYESAQELAQSTRTIRLLQCSSGSSTGT